MIKKLLGIAPKLEADGSYSPSKLALKLSTSPKSDYTPIAYEKYTGKKIKNTCHFHGAQKHENA